MFIYETLFDSFNSNGRLSTKGRTFEVVNIAPILDNLAQDAIIVILHTFCAKRLVIKQIV